MKTKENKSLGGLKKPCLSNALQLFLDIKDNAQNRFVLQSILCGGINGVQKNQEFRISRPVIFYGPGADKVTTFFKAIVPKALIAENIRLSQRSALSKAVIILNPFKIKSRFEIDQREFCHRGRLLKRTASYVCILSHWGALPDCLRGRLEWRVCPVFVPKIKNLNMDAEVSESLFKEAEKKAKTHSNTWPDVCWDSSTKLLRALNDKYFELGKRKEVSKTKIF